MVLGSMLYYCHDGRIAEAGRCIYASGRDTRRLSEPCSRGHSGCAGPVRLAQDAFQMHGREEGVVGGR